MWTQRRSASFQRESAAKGFIRGNSRHNIFFPLAEVLQKIPTGVILKSRKNARKVIIPKMTRNRLAQHLAKICGHCKIATFIKQVCAESRPLPIYSAALYRTAEHEHDVGVAVVSAPVAVFSGRASEL